MDIEKAIELGFLEEFGKDQKLVDAELAEAAHDLETAKESFDNGEYKWATVQSYYVMFHSARALLFFKGYREKKHYGINVILEDLVRAGKLESRYLEDFKAAKRGREDADYHYSYIQESAAYLLNVAEEFMQKMKSLIN